MSMIQKIIATTAKELQKSITMVVQSLADCESESYDDLVRAFVEDASEFNGGGAQIESLMRQLQAMKEFVPVEFTELSVIRMVKPVVRDFFFKKFSNEDEAFAFYSATDFSIVGEWGARSANGLSTPQEAFESWCVEVARRIVKKGE